MTATEIAEIITHENQHARDGGRFKMPCGGCAGNAARLLTALLETRAALRTYVEWEKKARAWAEWTAEYGMGFSPEPWNLGAWGGSVVYDDALRVLGDDYGDDYAL